MTPLAVLLAALLVAVIVAALARFDHDQRRIEQLETEIRAAHRDHTRHWEVA